MKSEALLDALKEAISEHSSDEHLRCELKSSHLGLLEIYAQSTPNAVALIVSEFIKICDDITKIAKNRGALDVAELAQSRRLYWQRRAISDGLAEFIPAADWGSRDMSVSLPQAVEFGERTSAFNAELAGLLQGTELAELLRGGPDASTVELDEYRDQLLRALAETENVRRRAQREREEAGKYAVSKFAADVVEAVENLRRGLDSLPAPSPGEPEVVARVRSGLESVEQTILSILERNAVLRHDPTGESFDPNLHQAVEEKESLDHTAGTIIHTWAAQWTLNGRLLRPAMVVVAKRV